MRRGGGGIPACSCASGVRCRYCGALLSRDMIGHYCPTVNCQWEHGLDECVIAVAKVDGVGK